MSILGGAVRLPCRSDLPLGGGPRRDADVFGVESEENAMTQPIAPCLWFNGNAEEAANYYVSVFKDAEVLHVDRCTPRQRMRYA